MASFADFSPMAPSPPRFWGARKSSHAASRRHSRAPAPQPPRCRSAGRLPRVPYCPSSLCAAPVAAILAGELEREALQAFWRKRKAAAPRERPPTAEIGDWGERFLSLFLSEMVPFFVVLCLTAWARAVATALTNHWHSSWWPTTASLTFQLPKQRTRITDNQNNRRENTLAKIAMQHQNCTPKKHPGNQLQSSLRVSSALISKKIQNSNKKDVSSQIV
jgi:hypothetical protein